MEIIMIIEVRSLEEYKAVVQYDRKFPRLFDLGDLNNTEEDIVFSILGEIRDRYDENGIVFSYADIARMAGIVRYDKRRDMYYPRTGEEFNQLIEVLQNKLKVVSYQKVTRLNSQGDVRAFDSIPLFTERFRVDHDSEELTVFLSNAVIQDQVINEHGEIEKERLTVVDLFNNTDWSQTQYLKFGREFHNILNSKYAKRLYRYLSEYRSFGRAIIDAKTFEKNIMKLTTPGLLKKRKEIIDKAVQALQQLSIVSNLIDDSGHPVIQDLQLERIFYRQTLKQYKFTFKHFSADLHKIESRSGNKVMVKLGNKKQSSLTETDYDTDTLVEILEVFRETLGSDPRYYNEPNKKYLAKLLETISKEVVIEALRRTAIDSRRGFGWTRAVLNNWVSWGVKTIEDIARYEKEVFGNGVAEQQGQPTNVPDWAKKDKKELPEEYRKVLNIYDELRSKVQLQKQILTEDYEEEKKLLNVISSWPSSIGEEYYLNTATLDEALELALLKERMLSNLDTE